MRACFLSSHPFSLTHERTDTHSHDHSLAMSLLAITTLSSHNAQLKANARLNRLSARRAASLTVSLTVGDDTEPADAGLERQVEAVGLALVDDVEDDALVGRGVVARGVVAALREVDAPVVSAEAVDGRVGDGLVDAGGVGQAEDDVGLRRGLETGVVHGRDGVLRIC